MSLSGRSGAFYTMAPPRTNNNRFMLGRVIVATSVFILGYTFAVNLSSPNADTTSSLSDPLVLLRGQGKEELSPVVTFTTRAEKCTDIKFLLPLDFAADVFKGQFKSQSSEDKTLLDNFFGGLCSGTYLEMGALNGVRFSNTYAFNKVLGWNGVLVELGPKNFAALQKNRPNEIANVHAGVCGEKKTLHYVESGAVGGVWEFSSQSFRDTWWKGVKLEDTPTIECEPLKDILEKHATNTTYFDFFSLDIEGAELDALLSLDYSRVGFGIIFVEADSHNKRKNNALRTFLEQQGYTFLWSKDRSDWFINNNFHSIYEDLIH